MFSWKMASKIFVEKPCRKWFECSYFLFLWLWYWLVMSLFIICNISGTCSATQVLRIPQWSVVQSRFHEPLAWIWLLGVAVNAPQEIKGCLMSSQKKQMLKSYWQSKLKLAAIFYIIISANPVFGILIFDMVNSY